MPRRVTGPPPGTQRATAITVEVTRRRGNLRVRVRDDGRGGADFGHGCGLSRSALPETAEVGFAVAGVDGDGVRGGPWR